jgi:hypothetical protein
MYNNDGIAGDSEEAIFPVDTAAVARGIRLLLLPCPPCSTLGGAAGSSVGRGADAATSHTVRQVLEHSLDLMDLKFRASLEGVERRS